MKPYLARILLSLGALFVVFSQVASLSPKPVQTDRIKRGHYLVTISGCNDCHTPFIIGTHGPEPDFSRMLSGHPEGAQLPPPPQLPPGPWSAVSAGQTAWSGPWGLSYSANLTPDKNTGLGIWTEAMFIKAMRTGKHFGNARPILPPMPWQNLSQATDEDLKSIFAYLQSIPAINNHVPDPSVTTQPHVLEPLKSTARRIPAL